MSELIAPLKALIGSSIKLTSAHVLLHPLRLANINRVAIKEGAVTGRWSAVVEPHGEVIGEEMQLAVIGASWVSVGRRAILIGW